RIAEETMADLDKNTVDMDLNFDETLKEPSVMPTRVPLLLVNGASGIAVGMATNMAPHNLTEVINATVAYIHNNDITIEELMQHVKAPDFPTGGTIYGYAGVKSAFETGRGRVVVRSRCEIETTSKGRERIVVSEIPYQVNKAELIIKIAELVNLKKVEGISNVNDESDRNGMRIVVDLKRDAIANVVLTKLFKYTAMQSSFSVNNIALVNGRPRMLNLQQLIKYFVEHRHDVVTRRTQYELDQAEKRAHILEGLIIASDNIDEVIKIIRSCKNPEEARLALIERFELSDIQSRAIVEMRLRQLTGLEQDKLHVEYEELMKTINHLKEILASLEMRMEIIENELVEIREKYGDERRTDIIYSSEEFNPEDFYADEEMIITVSHLGYIKRTPLSEFRTQNRGGVGSKGSNTRDEDFLEYIYPASMHDTLMFFTQKGRCFWKRVWDIPEGSKNSKGRAMQNLLNIEGDDKVNAFIGIKDMKDEEFINSHYLLFATKAGVIKKTPLEAYSRQRQNGVNAITLREGDEVVNVNLTTGDSEVIMANRNGRAIRFPEEKTRPIGRTSTGMKGMTLEGGDDEVIGMLTLPKGTKDTIMVVSEKGYGKRSYVTDPETGEDTYRITNRGGKGVKTINVTEKTGKLIAIKRVNDENDLMIINKSGITLRLSVDSFRVMGRATQGVRMINLDKRNDAIASVTMVQKSEAIEEELEALEGAIVAEGETPAVDATETPEAETSEILGAETPETPEEETPIEEENLYLL
nr:DNA gyrase subunit A [Bacteroidales bacterium]